MAVQDQEIKIHPNARTVFNEKAQSQLGTIVENAAVATQSPSGFQIDVEPSATLRERDISDFKLVGTTDPLGRETSRSFEWKGKRYGIAGPAYIEMMKFIDQLAKTGNVGDILSRKFIKDQYLDWLEMKFKGSVVTDWISFLMDAAEQVVQNHEVWIPISELHLQSAIQLGNITFLNLSQQVFERDFLSKIEVKAALEQEQQKVFKILRQQYQGLAAARLKIWSEPQRAVEVARKETEISLKLLTCYHLTWCKGELVSSSVPKGEEYTPFYHAIIFDENCRVHIKKAAELLPFNWTIDNKHLASMKSTGLEKIHLLRLKQKNEFQEQALDFFVGYGGSFMSRNVSEKILRLVVALEKFLSPSADVATQATIADRLAFSVGVDTNDRRRIVKTTKVIYGWRSKLVHEALEISEEQTLEEFLRDVWRLFIFLINNLDHYTTMLGFYEHIEEKKYT